MKYAETFVCFLLCVLFQIRLSAFSLFVGCMCREQGDVSTYYPEFPNTNGFPVFPIEAT